MKLLQLGLPSSFNKYKAMNNLLILLSLLLLLGTSACEKAPKTIVKEGHCASCYDLTFQNPTDQLPAGVTQEVIIALEQEGSYYSKGQISYSKDGKEIAVVIYKEKEGEWIGIKKTFTDADAVPAYNDTGDGGCVQNVPLRSTSCCEFQQQGVL